MRKRWKISIATLFLAAIGGAAFSFTGCTIFGCKEQLNQFVINSFEECADSGHAIIPSDPPKCILDKDHIFSKEPVYIQIDTPQPFEQISSPLTITGKARAKNNTVYYRLETNNQELITEGSFTGNSQDLGQWGEIHFELIFPIPSVPSGKLFLFEEGQSWNDKNIISIPLKFEIPVEKSDEETTGSAIPSPEKETINNTFDPLKDLDHITIPDHISLEVPFTSQAPFADWNHPYDEACEEASLIMVEYYLKDKELTRSKADSEIVLQVNWQKNHNYEVDVTTEELGNIAQSYYHRKTKVYTDDEVNIENIKKLLTGGYPIIIPAAGQMLGNPNFRGAGPPYHMLVITGYDQRGFITNDPGTKNGEDYRYDFETLMNAIHDWTNNPNTIRDGKKAMMVVGR